MRWWRFLLVCMLAFPCGARAATYYVATTGSDTGTGSTRCTRAQTIGTPVLTISVALACTSPGDTVQLAAGTYTQRIDLNSSAGGSTSGYVTLQGVKPLGPTVTDKTGSTKIQWGGNNVWAVYGRHLQYLKVRNLEVTGGSGGGIGIFGSSMHVEVTDNYVHHNNASTSALSAIRTTAKYSQTNNSIYCCEFGTSGFITVARNHVTNWTTGFNITLPTAATEAISSGGKMVNFLFEDNLVDAGQFIGIDLIGKTQQTWQNDNHSVLPIPVDSWPQKGIVRRNTIKNMRVGQGPSDAGIYCDGCREIVVEQNRIEDCPGYCIFMGTEENQFLISQIIMRYNTAVNCGTAIYSMGPPINASNPAIHGLSEFLRSAHNTGVKTKAGPVIRFNWAVGGASKNNIAVVNATVNVPYLWTATAPAANPVIDATLYWGSIEPDSWQYKGVTYFTFPSYQSGSGQDAHGLYADPLFTNITTRDLTLQPGSPALNGGVPLTTTAFAGSGNVVALLDAHWFSDGYQMVPGDSVQIGTALANITAVNYATNQITLDRVLTWAAGVGVSYPYVSTAPAMGACEGALCAMQTVGSIVGPDPSVPLIMNLPLNEGSGTVAHDATPNLHNGALGAGVTWGPGKLGTNSAVFDGSTTGVVTVTGLLGTPAASTLAAWIKPTGYPTGNAEVLTIGPFQAIRISASQLTGFYYTATGWSSVTVALALPLDTWTHVAYTTEPGSQMLYVNGEVVATATNASVAQWTGSPGTNTLLGAHGGGLTTYRYQGAIDEARVYNVVLSDVEVMALYRAQLTWKFLGARFIQ